ncbi:MAG: hypothetical protein J6T72_01475 [Alphaproteobacteria bacterium]|nr:hypothetical protein [Alphaproteobacteria bacterium]
MNTKELLDTLDKINPTDEQLQLCLELRKNIFPLPLYVKLPNGDHALTRKLERCMTVEGIATERGIYLADKIHPIKFGNLQLTVADLYLAATEVHPDARPLNQHDIFGEGEHTLSSMKFVNSTLDIILHWLNHTKQSGDKSMEFTNYNHELYALPSYASLADTTVVMYNLYCHEWSRTTPINEICDMGLFIPAKKIVTNGLKKHFAEQLGELSEHNKLFVYPPKPQEKATFPLSLYLRDQNGKYHISNELPVPDECEVEGIVIKDRIFLRKPITPGEIDKENPTIADLCALATAIHPEAKPLFFCGYAEQELTMLLFLFGKKYRQTAELLKENYGIEMPSFENNIAYIAGGDGYLKSAENAEKISLFSYKDEVIGTSLVNIEQIKHMIAVIQWK